ncbi:MAG: 50S ribosomal protein L19 [Candidatus Shikimatogenerans sp. JK-2022]|nr:50S ribosomal protein L19 [Candidatus Shikimatogenerans bostrichidophilus]
MKINELIKYLEKKYIKTSKLNKFNVGDNISVYYYIIEKHKTKSKIQVFKGDVISKKGDNKFNKTFIVRKIINNIGVEIIFNLYSPLIKNIIINTRAKIKRSKLFNIRYKG